MADQSLDLGNFLIRHCLPDLFADVANDYYVPLADWLRERRERSVPGTFVLGINGAQGTGKTTLSNFLAEYLRDTFDFSVAELSIDDIYLTRAERTDLARRVHPLLATRGVPGTHDIELGKAVIEMLCDLGSGDTASLPRFDKSVDDRRSPRDWPKVTGPIDLVIFEGWCVGSTAVPASDLEKPVNRLEADEDGDRAWRNYVNEQLATAYSELFSMLDALIFLQAPDLDAVYRWRLEQEHKLALSAGSDATHVMDEATVRQFLQHFERITRHNFVSLPAKADVVLELNEKHAVTRANYAS